MYFANTIMIDGIEVITGIDKLQIDRIETEKKIKMQVEELKEFKQIKARNEKSKAYYNNINEAQKSQKKILETVAIFKNIPISSIQDSDFTLQQREKMNQLKEKIQFNQAQIKELQKNIPEIIEQLKKKKVELLKSNAVYFEMPKDVIMLTGKQANEFISKIQANNAEYKRSKTKQLLTVSGDVIIDNRGKKVFFEINGKWESRTIEFLNDKIDDIEIPENELTDEQKEEIRQQEETERFAYMTEEEKQNEFESLKQGILAQSVHMKNELDIKGDSKALETSQAWYNSELQKLTEKYSPD